MQHIGLLRRKSCYTKQQVTCVDADWILLWIRCQTKNIKQPQTENNLKFHDFKDTGYEFLYGYMAMCRVMFGATNSLADASYEFADEAAYIPARAAECRHRCTICWSPTSAVYERPAAWCRLLSDPAANQPNCHSVAVTFAHHQQPIPNIIIIVCWSTADTRWPATHYHTPLYMCPWPMLISRYRLWQASRPASVTLCIHHHPATKSLLCKLYGNIATRCMVENQPLHDATDIGDSIGISTGSSMSTSQAKFNEWI